MRLVIHQTFSVSSSFIHYVIQHASLLLGGDIYCAMSTEFILFPSFLFGRHLSRTYYLPSTGPCPDAIEMNKL